MLSGPTEQGGMHRVALLWRSGRIRMPLAIRSRFKSRAARPLVPSAVAGLSSACDHLSFASLPFLCAFFGNARAQIRLDSCPTLETVKETQNGGGRQVEITEWLLVWLIANALFVVWRVLVVSQAESRHLAVRRQIAGQPLSQQVLRGRIGR